MKHNGKELKSTTLCHNLDITLDHNAWQERKGYLATIKHQLEMAIDGKVELTFEEMHYNYKSDSLAKLVNNNELSFR